MSFDKKIKELRIKSNLSRDELAKELGVSYSTIAKYESGTRTPDLETLIKISDYFNVSTDYLLSKTDLLLKDLASAFVESFFSTISISQEELENGELTKENKSKLIKDAEKHIDDIFKKPKNTTDK